MVVFWCWIIIDAITTCIAVSLGEIASRYPVSGGTYYWAFMLSPQSTLLGRFDHWMGFVGWEHDRDLDCQLWVSCMILDSPRRPLNFPPHFRTAQLILASVNIYHPDSLRRHRRTRLDLLGTVSTFSDVLTAGVTDAT